tara:strand:+ start:7569 stop:8213 length:645 start_codon:yes stop_codon:yes gene_type:complete
LPGKNIRSLSGKPLIAWTIEAALASRYISKVIVSTDCKKIANISELYGAEVPFLRPRELAKDDTLRNEVIKHALSQIQGYDYIILLQPTSPLRSEKEIDDAFERFSSANYDSCVSVQEQHPTPEWIFRLNEESILTPVSETLFSTNRQNLPKYYSLNGAIYIIKKNTFIDSNEKDPFLGKNTMPYVMPKELSFDIDDYIDFMIVENLISRRSNS